MPVRTVPSNSFDTQDWYQCRKQTGATDAQSLSCCPPCSVLVVQANPNQLHLASSILSVVFSKALKTASVHDHNNDLKMLFVKRFRDHGLDLPVMGLTYRQSVIGVTVSSL